MATRRIGLQSFFDPNQKGFSEIFAEQATKQRQRKEAALGEIRQTLSEKQLYGAYAANANKILEDQIKSIGASLDVDPSAYTDAVADYLKYYNYSEQFKGFINEAAASYKADKEVDYNTALKAVRDQYVKTGNLDELETNIMNGVDAEKVLLQTPGALKEDEVMKDRLSKLGDVTKLATTIYDLQRQGDFYLQQDTEAIKQAVNQAVEFDAQGNAVIKDMAALDRLGITQLMLGDQRVDALATQRLQREGKEINEVNKKEALRTMMQPFAKGERMVTREAKLVDNPEWSRRIKEQELALQRASLALTKKKENPGPLELRGSILMQTVQDMALAQSGKPQQTWKPYARLTKEGAPAKSPDGKPYIFQSKEFTNERANIEGKKYVVDNLFLDENYTLWAGVRSAETSKQESKVGTTPDGKPIFAETETVKYGKPEVKRFSPGQIELNATTTMQDEYNKIAAGLYPIITDIQTQQRGMYQETYENIRNRSTTTKQDTTATKRPSFAPFKQ